MGQFQDYYSQLKLLFLSPINFFKSVEQEKDYKTPLLFFFVLNTAVIIIAFLLSIPFLNIIPPNYPEALRAFFLPIKIFGTLFGIFFALLVPFIVSGFIHLGVLLLKGKNGFYNTFKPITYAMTLSLIYSLATTIISGLFSFVYSEQMIKLNTAQTTSADPSAIFHIIFGMWPMYTLLIIISVAAFIHAFYAEIIGVAKFQNFTNLRAFFAIVLIPMCFLVLFAIIFIIFGVGIALLASKGMTGAAISSLL